VHAQQQGFELARKTPAVEQRQLHAHLFEVRPDALQNLWFARQRHGEMHVGLGVFAGEIGQAAGGDETGCDA